MYASQEARDADIDELAAAAPERAPRAAHRRLDRASPRRPTAMPDDALGRSIERTPGGPASRRAIVVLMRLREVEIHHADLGAGYTAADWPPSSRRCVLDVDDQARPAPDAVPACAPTDLDRDVVVRRGRTRPSSGTGRRPGVVAHRPRRRRGPDQRRRRAAEDRGMVT